VAFKNILFHIEKNDAYAYNMRNWAYYGQGIIFLLGKH
jgi:hypothetical protein